MESNKFSLFKRMKSFKYAFNGIKMLLLKEHNARIHLAAAILVILATLLLKVQPMEWLVLLIAMGFVFSMELINTAIEQLSNFVEPQWNNKIGAVKDYAAGAVLVSSITALSVGIVVFIPKLLSLLSY